MRNVNRFVVAVILLALGVLIIRECTSVLAATTFLNAANKAMTTLDGGITDTATTLDVQTGDGAEFPASNFRIVIDTEVIHVTTRTGDTFSPITRGAESSTATAHSDEAVVSLNVTAGYIEELQTAINALENIDTESELESQLTDTTDIITNNDTNITIGVVDDTRAMLGLTGDGAASSSGGKIDLEMAADYDSGAAGNEWNIDVFNDDLRVRNAAKIWKFVAEGSTQLPDAPLEIDDTQGDSILFKHSSYGDSEIDLNRSPTQANNRIRFIVGYAAAGQETILDLEGDGNAEFYSTVNAQGNLSSDFDIVAGDDLFVNGSQAYIGQAATSLGQLNLYGDDDDAGGYIRMFFGDNYDSGSEEFRIRLQAGVAKIGVIASPVCIAIDQSDNSMEFDPNGDTKILSLWGTVPGGVKTVSSGAVTIDSAHHNLQPESGTSDTVDTITYASVWDGCRVSFCTEDDGDVITFAETGNLLIPTILGIDDEADYVEFRYNGDLSKWCCSANINNE